MLMRAGAAAEGAEAARESAGPLRDALVESALSRAAYLAIGDEPLVFGRLDGRDGHRLYIGRAAVYDDDHEPLVTDWRAPAAEPFYRATPGDPMGVVPHRARLERAGVLIVGPSPIFLRYIDQVLPSLGETATLATAVELSSARAASIDPPSVAHLKGDARMADVIGRAVANLPHPLEEE